MRTLRDKEVVRLAPAPTAGKRPSCVSPRSVWSLTLSPFCFSLLDPRAHGMKQYWVLRWEVLPLFTSQVRKSRPRVGKGIAQGHLAELGQETARLKSIPQHYEFSQLDCACLPTLVPYAQLLAATSWLHVPIEGIFTLRNYLLFT